MRMIRLDFDLGPSDGNAVMNMDVSAAILESHGFFTAVTTRHYCSDAFTNTPTTTNYACRNGKDPNDPENDNDGDDGSSDIATPQSRVYENLG